VPLLVPLLVNTESLNDRLLAGRVEDHDNSSGITGTWLNLIILCGTKALQSQRCVDGWIQTSPLASFRIVKDPFHSVTRRYPQELFLGMGPLPELDCSVDSEAQIVHHRLAESVMATTLVVGSVGLGY
jgi:hypothetical protein